MILKLLMSDILGNRKGVNYLVFFGFALIGSIYADKIIQHSYFSELEFMEALKSENKSLSKALTKYEDCIADTFQESDKITVKELVDKFHAVPIKAQTDSISSNVWAKQVSALLEERNPENQYRRSGEMLVGISR